MDGPIRCSLKLGREEHFRGEKTKKEIGRKKDSYKCSLIAGSQTGTGPRQIFIGTESFYYKGLSFLRTVSKQRLQGQKERKLSHPLSSISTVFVNIYVFSITYVCLSLM
jgi:hypothetical protein